MRRWLLVALGFAAAVSAAWAGAWYLIADRLRLRFDDWVAARRAEGLTAEHGGLTVAGFPWHWDMTVVRPAMAGAGPTVWTWQGQAVEARLRPWEPRDVRLRFPGEHRFAAGAGDLAESWAARAARPDGRAVLGSDGRLDRLEIDLGDAELRRRPEPAPVRIARLAGSVALYRPAPADHRTETLDLRLRADDAVLVEAPVAALGPRVALAELDLSFKGRLPAARTAAAVAAWRDDGGTMEINRVAMKWGPVDADGNGTLTLDAENRPLGAFTARWRGYVETVDALAATGVVRPRDAAGAKIVLSLLARQGPGGNGQVDIPLTAQDGRLFVAGFALVRLPPLNFE
jgi:hypothetical protein